MKLYKAIVPILVLLLAPLFFSSAIANTSYTQILIQNGNYLITFISGGNGTKENPYIIQNLTLNVSGLPAILIKNSHKYLIIRNVTVFSSGAFYAVKIEDSSNVTLEDVRILQSDNFGIGIIHCHDIKVINLHIRNCPIPLRFGSPSDRNNYFKDVYIDGIKAAFFDNRSNFRIEGTYSYVSIYRCSNVSGEVKVISEYMGVEIISSKKVSLKVSVTAKGYGIRIYQSREVKVSDSKFSRVGYNTFLVQNSSDVEISDVIAGEAFQGFINAYNSEEISIKDLATPGSIGQFVKCRGILVKEISGSRGLSIFKCSNVTLESLSFQHNSHNVLEISYSYGVKVENSRFVGIRYMMGKFRQSPVNAIEVLFSKNVSFINDTFYNDWKGISFVSSQEILLNDDYFLDCTQGIAVKEEMSLSKGYTIKNCEFISNDVAGIDIYAGTEFYIVHNLFEDNKGWALVIMTNGTAEVYLNTFIGNSKDVEEWCSHLYYNPELKKGNYWSGYHGVDRNHDGIGDVPYKVSNYSEDKYPLMKPTFTTVYTPKVPKGGLSDVDKFFIFVGAVVAISIALHYAHFRRKKGEE